MSTSRSSSPSDFNPEAFRQQIAARLSLTPPVSSVSVSTGGATRQPSSRPPVTGRSGLSRDAMNSGGTIMPARAGVSSVGGLSGKSSIKYPVTLVPAGFCGGVVLSKMGSFMCVKEGCTYISHRKDKVDGFPDESIYCLSGGRSRAFASPYIKQSDCTPEIEEWLDSLDISEDEWISFCSTFEEELAKQVDNKANVSIKEEVYVITEDAMESLLVESQPVPRRFKVELDATMKEEEENNPIVSALLNILEFTKSADDAFAFVSLALEESHENDVTIAQRIDYLTQLAARVETVTGDRKFITNQYGSVAEAFYQFDKELNSVSVSIQDLEFKMEKLEDIEDQLDMKIQIANEESAKALNQLKRDMEAANHRSDTPDLSAIMDDAGRIHNDLEIGIVRGKCFTFKSLIEMILDLKKEVADLQNMVAAKGGVSIGPISFASVDELRDLIRKELPNGVKAGVIRCFVDAITLFVYVNDLSSSEQANYKKLNENLTSQDCALIAQAHSAMCPQYTGTAKEYAPGKSIQCFSDPEGWDGEGLDGKQSSIADEADKSASKLKGQAENLLRNAPTLLSLALSMGDRSEKWHTKLHAHLAHEIKTLSKLKLPVDDIFLLFSDLFRLIAELFYAERAAVHDIDDHVDSVERLTVIIWTTLKVHGLMQDFIDAKFKNHPIVQAAFVRFLTTKIGQNTAAALASNVKDLEKKLSALDTKVDVATKKAKESMSAAQTVGHTLTALKNKNPQWQK